MIARLTQALRYAVGRTGALMPIGALAVREITAHRAPRTELDHRIESARRRLKASIPPPPGS